MNEIIDLLQRSFSRREKIKVLSKLRLLKDRFSYEEIVKIVDGPTVEEARERISIVQKKRYEENPMSDYTKEVLSAAMKKCWKNPSRKMISHLENLTYLGIKCYSNDGLFFLSLQERDCYYWLRDVLKVKVKKGLGKLCRFDFIIDGKIILEYHPTKPGIDDRTYKQYYKERRELLNKLSYKNLKLIVMTSLSDEEKERVGGLLKYKGW